MTRSTHPHHAPETTWSGDSRYLWTTVAVGLLVAVALVLRLWGIEERVFSHPENFVPGIDVPDWVRRPPERLTVGGVLSGTRIDGHPPGYFLALLPWVKVFGNSLLSLRLPSALLGALSVWVVFLVARRERGPSLGVLAAAALAFHGFHIYWSQMARMYVPVAFLGLLSTLLLYRMVADGRRRSHAVYLGITAAALWTQIYAWPLVLGQMIWVVTGILGGERRHAALRTQLLAVVAAAPVVQLAVYQNPSTRWHQPLLGFFGFGYLFENGLPFWADRPWSPDGRLLAVFCLALLAAGVWSLAGRTEPVPCAPAPAPAGRGRAGPFVDWIAAALMSSLMLVLAWRWLTTSRPVLAAAGVPLLVIGAGRLAERALQAVERSDGLSASARRYLARLPQSPFLALVPIAAMAALSAVRGVLVARGTIVFLPFLLLLVSLGIDHLYRHRARWLRAAGALAAATLLGLCADSIRFARQANSSPRDYARIAAELERRARPNDLILVRNDFFFPPLFYYLEPTLHPQLVYRYYPETLATADPTARVWLVRICTQRPLPEALVALQGLHLADVFPAHQAELQLYVRDPRRARSDPYAWRREGELSGCFPGDPAEREPVEKWHYESTRDPPDG